MDLPSRFGQVQFHPPVMVHSEEWWNPMLHLFTGSDLCPSVSPKILPHLNCSSPPTLRARPGHLLRVNETKKRSALVGPVELSNVYARHFAKACLVHPKTKPSDQAGSQRADFGRWVFLVKVLGPRFKTNCKPM